MPKHLRARFVTKSFTPRPPSVAALGYDHQMPVANLFEALSGDDVLSIGKSDDVLGAIGPAGGMFSTRTKLSVQMHTTPAAAKHDIDVPLCVNVTPTPPPALESGVFLAPDLAPGSEVTLVVYAWHNVQPGTLAWTFPTVRAAVSAAYAMKNAVKWAIVRGHEQNLEIARRAGTVMIENC